LKRPRNWRANAKELKRLRVPSYNLAIVGFGNVGRALLRLLIAKRNRTAAEYEYPLAADGDVAPRRVGWFATQMV